MLGGRLFGESASWAVPQPRPCIVACCPRPQAPCGAARHHAASPGSQRHQERPSFVTGVPRRGSAPHADAPHVTRQAASRFPSAVMRRACADVRCAASTMFRPPGLRRTNLAPGEACSPPASDLPPACGCATSWVWPRTRGAAGVRLPLRWPHSRTRARVLGDARSTWVRASGQPQDQPSPRGRGPEGNGGNVRGEAPDKGGNILDRATWGDTAKPRGAIKDRHHKK